MSEETSAGAFQKLAPGIQRKLWDLKWPSLRPIQVRAIEAYTSTDRDLLIMADTAGGKTEAAFLPILSEVAELPAGSVHAMYVGPLKALINDQFGRVEELCQHLDVPVHRWHGDVGASHKQALIDAPRGVLLITPESLEALLIRRTRSLAGLFASLRAIVIDELHSFLENERGLHLRSLLSRLGGYIASRTDGKRTRRIGLSATIGDVEVARDFLNPDDKEQVAVLASSAGASEILMRVHAYLESELPPRLDLVSDPIVDDPRIDEPQHSLPKPRVTLDAGAKPEHELAPDPAGIDAKRLALLGLLTKDLVEHCRGHANLVFANSKGDIEILADLANEECRNAGIPESFLVHHGSLSRDLREDTEATMKDGLPFTTVCSSTLEMGIDIGSVRMVGQVGAPWSVASLRQRAGRSGRRAGEVRRLRIYCDWEDEFDAATASVRQLPLDLLQATAVCERMLAKWIEPPRPPQLDLSTLAHQTMSLIKERGAVTAFEAHEILACRGPFRGVSPVRYAALLRDLAANDVLEQGADGKLILGLQGERIVDERDFYAAFQSDVEFTVVNGTERIGTLPLARLPQLGDHLVFAGRRWQVSEVDDRRKVLYVVHARRRRRPSFVSEPGDVHPEIREAMRALLERDDRPAYLTTTAQAALDRARALARDGRWTRRGIVELSDHHSLWLTWTGTASQRTLLAWLESQKLGAEDLRVAIRVSASASELRSRVQHTARMELPLEELARFVRPLAIRKFDTLLSEDLLRCSAAADRLDGAYAKRVIDETVALPGDSTM